MSDPGAGETPRKKKNLFKKARRRVRRGIKRLARLRHDLRERGIPPRPRAARLRKEYAAKGLDRVPDTFVLYRIVGNDLYPRHKLGQSLENVRFILEHEPPLADCEKRWVVNRIFDADAEAAILELLERFGQRHLHIPFDWQEYARAGWDLECFPPGFFLSGAPDELHEVERARAHARARRHKNNYAMHNNGARNAALREGRGVAKWVLPWDGNCFVTASAWADLTQAIRAQPWLKYFVVPMARITENDDLLRPDFTPPANEEPQILFRRDAAEEFDERHPYGRRPKVELLWRLGVPGWWDEWAPDPWDFPRPRYAREARQFGTAGWVARLSSGQKHLEESSIGSIQARANTRLDAILATLDHLDGAALERSLDPRRLAFYDESRLEALRAAYGRPDAAGALGRRLVAEADAALARGPYSVMDKTTLAPSGNRHDYFHPAPYWWPNPDAPDGLPYVFRDGVRVPGTELDDPESGRYDRARLQRLFDDTTLLALAAYVGSSRRHAEHGARLVRHWFLDPATRMTPHLRFAQVRIGHDDEFGLNGIVEAKDLYFLLDAVRLLERTGALGAEDHEALGAWLREYLDWLLGSPYGRKEASARNNRGTFYDLQVAAIAAWLGDVRVLVDTFFRSRERILQQFAPDGSQPHELTRTLTQHYCSINLQGWTALATIGTRCGEDLWSFAASDGRSLAGAIGRFLQLLVQPDWPHPQIKPFDRERLLPLYFAFADHGGRVPGLDPASLPHRFEVKPVFSPNDAIQPFWSLGG